MNSMYIICTRRPLPSAFHAEYFSVGNYNVILVDWSVEAKKQLLTQYPEARQDCVWVGALLVSLLKVLQTKGGDLKKMHCIGHSLGTHICHQAALGVGKALGRVTGLDPADPTNSWTGMKGDAIFTDIIHTSNFASHDTAYGDVDFYPNGGKDQPGCLLNDGKLNCCALMAR